MAASTVIATLAAAAGLAFFARNSQAGFMNGNGMGEPRTYYFDYRGQEISLDRLLIDRLEAFGRAVEQSGGRAYISPVEGAMLRPGDSGQHGKGLAADIMVLGIDLGEAYKIARRIGFHGIGLYPDWKPAPGIHLDMRSERTASNPATWSAFNVDGNQAYFGINKVLKA